MCEMLLVRGSRRKSLQIFNTATRILASRRTSSSSSPSPEDSVGEHTKLLTDEQKPESIDCGAEPAVVAPQGLQEQKCEQKDEPPQKNQFLTRATDNCECDTRPVNKPAVPRKPNSLVAVTSSPRPVSPRLDFGNTDFSLMEKSDSPSANSSRRSSLKDANANFTHLPDMANLNISQGKFFSTRNQVCEFYFLVQIILVTFGRVLFTVSLQFLLLLHATKKNYLVYIRIADMIKNEHFNICLIYIKLHLNIKFILITFLYYYHHHHSSHHF